MKIRPKFLAIACVSVFVTAAPLLATPSQEDVFKSISDNVGQSQDSGPFLAVLLAIAAVAIAVAVLSKRRERGVAVPKALNNRGKLLKEVMRATNLRPAETKMLKILGDAKSVDNPLVLMLCPSVLEKAMREKKGKLERKVAIGLAKKAGLIPANAK
jgi:hypothetical protein